MEGLPRRYCIRCNRPIEECMGFTLIRDMLPLFEGRPVEHVREQCGVCVDKPDAMQFVQMLE
jgi:hypothetical protein